MPTKLKSGPTRHRSAEKGGSGPQDAFDDGARALILAIVVVAVVASPFYAMTRSIDPESFAAYLAPVTTVAGAVMGYWFGARSGDGPREPRHT